MIAGTQPTFVTLEKMKIPTVMYTGAYGAGGGGVFPRVADPDPRKKTRIRIREINRIRIDLQIKIDAKVKIFLVFISLLLT